jgi:hypothetical protein
MTVLISVQQTNVSVRWNEIDLQLQPHVSVAKIRFYDWSPPLNKCVSTELTTEIDICSTLSPALKSFLFPGCIRLYSNELVTFETDRQRAVILVSHSLKHSALKSVGSNHSGAAQRAPELITVVWEFWVSQTLAFCLTWGSHSGDSEEHGTLGRNTVKLEESRDVSEEPIASIFRVEE